MTVKPHSDNDVVLVHRSDCGCDTLSAVCIP